MKLNTMKKLKPEIFDGVWSATPTPFDDKMRVDEKSLARLIEHHLRLGVKGLFLAGTCGEGPWMPDTTRRRLVQSTVALGNGRLGIAVQVTDNSSARIGENINQAKEDGADLVVIAPPYFLINATPQNIEKLYVEAIDKSTLPVGIYDRGKHAAVFVPDAVLKTLYAHPKVVMIKDSSSDPKRRALALAARQKNPNLKLLDGDEFRCDEYISGGYDGLMLGGAAFNGFLANQILQAARAGKKAEAQALQARMNRVMFAVYGGEKIKCWLTGEKELLRQIGVFKTTNSFLNYPLTPACQKAIARLLKTDADVLLP